MPKTEILESCNTVMSFRNKNTITNKSAKRYGSGYLWGVGVKYMSIVQEIF